MRLIVPAIVYFVLAGATLDGQTLDEIVDLAVAVRGGAARIKAVRAQRLTGHIWLGTEQGAINVEIRRPSSIREEFVAGQQQITRISNGRTGYIKSGNEEAQMLGMSDVKSMAASADLDGPLVDYKQRGNQIEYGGAVELDGRKAHKLIIRMRDGQQRVDYIDAQTWTETKWEGKIQSGGKEFEVESYFSDYRYVDGILCAFRIDSVTLGVTLKQKLVFDRIEINPAVPESRFERP